MTHLSSSEGSWEPGARVAGLLFLDFEGAPANPDEVISEGLDGGYRDRTEELADVLRDLDEGPWSRFLACLALTRWADEAYDAVAEAARTPELVPWRGVSYDRFHSQDDTFWLLADAVGDSDDMVEERGTGTERLQAVRALLAIADRVQFDRRIGALLRRDLVVDNLADIQAVVDLGIVRLAKEQLSLDVLVRSGDRIEYGVQLKDVDSASSLKSATRGIAEKQLLGQIDGQKVAILDVHDIKAALTDKILGLVAHRARLTNATFVLRFEDGSITVPANGPTYP
ncbi:hypothetical protein [Streptomyces sp. NL15-2K]|uniref:hypothetical protein n=1 Tax=Streptomyces sp. NL15-2K TaxID=376149 RepID=UPI000FFA67A8|nr:MULTISPECIES: hypothetical protein [Actinomycetes]WKX09096.1 hypothetical protein Q4V64_16985 [Kutzneria buriramensis]GCB49401.1 hypothetical protein SNL152K_6736 [Streptomyces sp. NL15-2K]